MPRGSRNYTESDGRERQRANVTVDYLGECQVAFQPGDQRSLNGAMAWFRFPNRSRMA